MTSRCVARDAQAEGRTGERRVEARAVDEEHGPRRRQWHPGDPGLSNAELGNQACLTRNETVAEFGLTRA
jgi:hypothetical protein